MIYLIEYIRIHKKYINHYNLIIKIINEHFLFTHIFRYSNNIIFLISLIMIYIFYLIYNIYMKSKQVNSEEIAISLNDIETDVENDNYKIASKVLNLISDSEYKISGSCTECKINVNQNTDMTITLNSISLINSNDGPFIIGKSAKVNLILEGES